MNRAQAHTLEAFVAALLLVTGLVFASQATAVTPLSESTSNQHIENQQRALADDLLSATAETGALREAVVHWNETTGFVGTPEDRTYYTQTPTNASHPLSSEFGVFDGNHLAYNVDLLFEDDEGRTDSIRMVEMGSPSDNAVVATRSVVLYDATELSAGPAEGTALADLEEGAFYAEDVDPGSQVYTVVEVRIVVWRL